MSSFFFLWRILLRFCLRLSSALGRQTGAHAHAQRRCFNEPRADDRLGAWRTEEVCKRTGDKRCCRDKRGVTDDLLRDRSRPAQEVEPQQEAILAPGALTLLRCAAAVAPAPPSPGALDPRPTGSLVQDAPRTLTDRRGGASNRDQESATAPPHSENTTAG